MDDVVERLTYFRRRMVGQSEEPELHALLGDAIAEIERLRAQAAPSGWMPIETAPKDGTIIDLWAAGQRRSNCWWGRYDMHSSVPWGEPHWNGCKNYAPTHWQPLPAPPGASQPEQQDVTLDRYRYAAQWAGADAWDGCSDCQQRLQWALEMDGNRLDVNGVAAIGHLFLAQTDREAPTSSPDVRTAHERTHDRLGLAWRLRNDVAHKALPPVQASWILEAATELETTAKAEQQDEATPPAPEPQAVREADGPLKLDTESEVFFYEQDHYYLSNFSAFNLEWKGYAFPTSEHAYQAMKFWRLFTAAGDRAFEAIASAPSAHEAFKIAEAGKEHRDPNWDHVKVKVMGALLRAKCAQHEYVRRKLLATGSRTLIENSWRDDFWGWGPNRDGQNMLGKLWMQVREELRALAPQPTQCQASWRDGECALADRDCPNPTKGDPSNCPLKAQPTPGER